MLSRQRRSVDPQHHQPKHAEMLRVVAFCAVHEDRLRRRIMTFAFNVDLVLSLAVHRALHVGCAAVNYVVKCINSSRC